MKLKWMSFKNFRLFRQNYVDLSGVTLASIIGRYTDNWSRSNETGKSTLGEALMYLLFEFKATSTYDDLVTWGYADDGMEVSGEFEYEGQICRLKRSWSPKNKTTKGNFEFLLNGDKQGKHQAEAKKLFSQFIGIDANIAFATWYFLQGKADKLTTSDPSDRKDYLSSVLKADYEDHYNVARQRLKKTNDKLEIVKQAKVEIQKVVPQMQEASASLAQCIEAEQRLGDAEKLIIAELSSVSKKLGEQTIIAKDAERLPALRQELSQIDEWMKHLVKKANEAIDSHGKKIKQLEELELSHKNQTNKQAQLTEQLKNLVANVSAAGYGTDSDQWMEAVRSPLSEIDAQLGSKRRHLADVESSLVFDWSGKASCPTCGQSATPQHLEQHMTGLRGRKQVLQEELAALDVRRSEAVESVASMQSVLHEYNRVSKEIHEITAGSMKYDQEHDNFKQSAGFAKQIVDQLKTEHDQYTVRREAVSKEVERIESAMLNDQSDSLKAQEDRLKIAQQAKVSERMQVSSSITQWKQHIALLEDRKSGLEAQVAEAPALEARAAVQSAVTELFHRDGLSLMKIKQAAGLIQLHANSMLSEILPDYTLSVVVDSSSGRRGTLDFKVMTGTGEHSYASFSGGARKVIDICLRMSLAKILADGTGRTFRTLFLDEVMADLDEVNREAMMKLIRTLSKNFASIFVISHEKEIQTAFPQVVLVERTGSQSQLSMMDTASIQ